MPRYYLAARHVNRPDDAALKAVVVAPGPVEAAIQAVLSTRQRQDIGHFIFFSEHTFPCLDDDNPPGGGFMAVEDILDCIRGDIDPVAVGVVRTPEPWFVD